MALVGKIEIERTPVAEVPNQPKLTRPFLAESLDGQTASVRAQCSAGNAARSLHRISDMAELQLFC
jgi:hypothetical protein